MRTAYHRRVIELSALLLLCLAGSGRAVPGGFRVHWGPHPEGAAVAVEVWRSDIAGLAALRVIGETSLPDTSYVDTVGMRAFWRYEYALRARRIEGGMVSVFSESRVGVIITAPTSTLADTLAVQMYVGREDSILYSFYLERAPWHIFIHQNNPRGYESCELRCDFDSDMDGLVGLADLIAWGPQLTASPALRRQFERMYQKRSRFWPTWRTH